MDGEQEEQVQEQEEEDEDEEEDAEEKDEDEDEDEDEEEEEIHGMKEEDVEAEMLALQQLGEEFLSSTCTSTTRSRPRLRSTLPSSFPASVGRGGGLGERGEGGREGSRRSSMAMVEDGDVDLALIEQELLSSFSRQHQQHQQHQQQDAVLSQEEEEMVGRRTFTSGAGVAQAPSVVLRSSATPFSSSLLSGRGQMEEKREAGEDGQH